MRSMLLTIALSLLLASSFPAAAQDTLPYEWQAAGITLVYPAHWNAPLPVEQDGQQVLELAQVLVDSPLAERPPAVPIITFIRVTDASPPDNNLLNLMTDALADIGIDTLDEAAQGLLLDTNAAQITGTSADAQLFGIARAASLAGSDVLIVVGRSAGAQRGDFTPLFDLVAGSASLTIADTAETPEDIPAAYGVLWQTQRTLADAEGAFLNLIGLVYGPDDTLYTYERDLGAIAVDAATGSILSITPNDHITAPADIAVSADGTIYVADTSCGCIFTLTPDGAWLDQDNEVEDEVEIFDPANNPSVIGGFGEGAPAHLTSGPDGALYATNVTSAGSVMIQVIEGGQFSSVIRFDDDVFEQPLLATAPTGDIYALTQTGELLILDGTQFTTASALGPTAAFINDLDITADGKVILAAGDQGVLILSAEGELINQPGTLVSDSPLPGELVMPVGVAVDARGSLYIADSNGTFGAITAMSTDVAPDRVGSTSLIPSRTVQGALTVQVTEQSWTYTAAAGERITVTAIDNLGGVLDLALRLLDSDGVEIAFNDNHTSLDILNPTDAQLFDVTLSVEGVYTIIVEQMAGEGAYSLGLSLTQTLTLDSTGSASASGQLGMVLPIDIYAVNGAAGQSLTITLESTDGDLDPLLRLFGPDGGLIAENDDADDTTLGTDAQIANISLSAAGLYRLEAARFEGAGHYRLTIAPAA